MNTPADVVDRVERVRKTSRKSVLLLIQGQDGPRWVPLSLETDTKRAPG